MGAGGILDFRFWIPKFRILDCRFPSPLCQLLAACCLLLFAFCLLLSGFCFLLSAFCFVLSAFCLLLSTYRPSLAPNPRSLAPLAHQNVRKAVKFHAATSCAGMKWSGALSRQRQAVGQELRSSTLEGYQPAGWGPTGPQPSSLFQAALTPTTRLFHLGGMRLARHKELRPVFHEDIANR